MKYVLFALTTTAALFGDVRVKSNLTAGGTNTESVVYTKGARQRLEYGKDAILLQQCDRKRMLQLDEANKSFMVLETNVSADAAPASKGGVVTVTTTITDTGETKDMFGYKARHIKSAAMSVPSPEACNKASDKVETDGWYIDLEGATLACSFSAGAAPGGCQDQVKPVVNGSAKLGFPVAYTITTTHADGKAETIAMQVAELETKDLEASLFDVPESWADAKAKKSGTARVAVAPVVDKTGQAGGTYTQQVFQGLAQAKVEAVQLNQGSQAEQQAAATKAEADYILIADVTEVKHPEQKTGGKKIGGLMARASGLINAKEAWEAKVDYKLLNVDGTPVAASFASGKTGGGSFNVLGAVNLAATVGSMMFMGPMGAQMMTGGNLGKMLTSMQGGGMTGPGMMGGMGAMGMGGGRGGMDPSLAGLQMLASTQSLSSVGGGMPGASGNPEAAKAVNAAVAEMVKAVVGQVKK